jgi:Tol biopolymer transport system component
MIRIAVLALLLLVVWGCEGYERAGHHAGPNAAYAAAQPDSFPTVTRRLSADARTDWQVAPLPDGRHLVVTDWWETGDLGVRDIATGEFRRLTNNTAPYQPGFGTSPQVSPDGLQVVYTWIPSDNSGYQLQVVTVAGGDPRVIHQTTANLWIYPQDWSRDGRTILAMRRQEDGTTQIVLVPLEGGPVRAIKTLDWRVPRRMNLSPDGQFILYDFPTRADSNEYRDLFLIDLVTGRETRLVQHTADDRLLGWTPDGRHVLFLSDRGGAPGAWLIAVENGRPTGEPVPH